MGKFSNRATAKFERRMRPKAVVLYEALWPGCRYKNLRDEAAEEDETHVLDEHYGIDAELRLPTGSKITLQEKYRRHNYLRYGDFTQCYRTGVGSEYEKEGEWFHLTSQLYFYGWATADESGFERWALLDVLIYKALVESHGGLQVMGDFRQNAEYGSATFYAIPMDLLRPAVVVEYVGGELHNRLPHIGAKLPM